MDITFQDEELFVDGVGTDIYVRRPTSEELRTQYGLCLEVERMSDACVELLTKFGIDRRWKKIFMSKIIEAWCA